jgi:hypothetical protein
MQRPDAQGQRARRLAPLALADQPRRDDAGLARDRRIDVFDRAADELGRDEGPAGILIAPCGGEAREARGAAGQHGGTDFCARAGEHDRQVWDVA